MKAANFARGVEESIERGVHLQARYGYRKSNGGGSELAIVPAEAKQVERAFELRSQGFSWEAIADRMNASGAKPRPYKRDGVVQQAVWTHKTVRQLVVGQGPDEDRSVYLGMAWNGTHVLEDAHPAIVTAELFDAANDTRGTKFSSPDGPGKEHLLKGLVFCSGCGYRMTYASGYVRCREAQHGAGRCPGEASCPVPELEEIVWSRFERQHLGEGKSGQIEGTNGHVQARSGTAWWWRSAPSRRARKGYLLADSPSDERDAGAGAEGGAGGAHSSGGRGGRGEGEGAGFKAAAGPDGQPRARVADRRPQPVANARLRSGRRPQGSRVA